MKRELVEKRKVARYELWGRRLHPDQTDIDTYIDFIRFWFGLDKRFLAIEKGENEYRTDVRRMFLTRLFVFENFLPDHVWADPNKKFSSLLENLSSKYNDVFLKSAEIDEIESIQTFKEIAKWMASLNVSRSLDISARAKGRERWWAQYFPPYSEDMFSHEIFLDETSKITRRPFKKIENPKYTLTGRSGEVLYWLFSALSTEDNKGLNAALDKFYCDENPYGVVFRLMDKFVKFLFYESKDNSSVRKEIIKLIDKKHSEDFKNLLISLEKEESKTPAIHTFPKDFNDSEKEIYSRWCNGLSNIFANSNSKDVAVLRASKYLVWTNIKFLIVRSRKCILNSKNSVPDKNSLNPEILISFPGVGALQSLVQKSRICFNEIHRSIESAHEIEMKKHEESEEDTKKQRRRFNDEHGSYLTRRGKKLGVIHPPGSGGRHFFTIDEAFLDVLIAANFSDDPSDDIIEFSKLLENLRLNEGLIFDLDSLKKTHSLKSLVREETSGFDINIRILKDKIKNLGILQEASDSNAYVVKPQKSHKKTKEN